MQQRAPLWRQARDLRSLEAAAVLSRGAHAAVDVAGGDQVVDVLHELGLVETFLDHSERLERAGLRGTHALEDRLNEAFVADHRLVNLLSDAPSRRPDGPAAVTIGPQARRVHQQPPARGSWSHSLEPCGGEAGRG